MIRYSEGLQRNAHAVLRRLSWYGKQAIGAAHRYEVFRPPVDHTVYDVDNRVLSSAPRVLASVHHTVSWHSESSKACIVEFEHGFSLVGHLDATTDFRVFKDELPKRLERFAAWLDPGRHRIVGASAGAARSAAEIMRRAGISVPETAFRTVHWASEPVHRPQHPGSRMEVFHFGGAFPYSKGTHELIAAASMCPSVHFTISVDLRHPLVQQTPPPNITLIPSRDKQAYLRALNRADVLAHPVFADGWGVVIEALARGMPIVAYDSYDKDEAVIDGESGRLITLEDELSFYDGFFVADWKNWSEYNSMVREAISARRVRALAEAFAAYDADRERLLRHGAAARRIHASRHAPSIRLRALSDLYAQLGASVASKRTLESVTRLA